MNRRRFFIMLVGMILGFPKLCEEVYKIYQASKQKRHFMTAAEAIETLQMLHSKAVERTIDQVDRERIITTRNFYDGYVSELKKFGNE